jgi:polysaccharide biosynthesis protein PslG
MFRPALLLTLLALVVSARSAPPRLAPADLGIFGIGSCYTNSRRVEDYERWIPQMAEAGLRHYRAVATPWHVLEPERGKWDWRDLDAQMDYLDAQRLNYGGLLLSSPDWNTDDRPGTMPINNLQGWAHYVTETVRHCRGRIHRWEVWNEPPNFAGKDQTPADYARIVVAAFDAAKAADPECTVGLAAKSAHISYLAQVIRAGAKDHFDYITLHPYEILDTVAANTGTEPVFMNIVPTLRKMLAEENPARRDVPVIFTELGSDARSDPDRAAHALVKAYTMSAAQGVACVQWFEGRDGDSGPMGLLDGAGQPRPTYRALKEMITHLGQRPAYLGWVPVSGRHRAFVFSGAAGPVLVAWTQNGGACEIEPGPDAQAIDPLTGNRTPGAKYPLTAEPRLFTGISGALVEEAKANRHRPMHWWGADYSAAESVSLTTGENQQLRGLRSLSGDSIAKSVVAYGGSARAGGVPGGNVFVVDPSFLCYDRTPLEVTVVCRRNEANDNAGFKLVYEAPSGFRTAGTWYTIPDNKEWHTARFRIEDPQFVCYWGYNFALESDGNVYNRYYLRSVEVRKPKPGER